MSANSIAARYSGAMATRQPLALLWLLSDVRNDAALEGALARLPHGSGFVFRHYHLGPAERQARFVVLSALARGAGIAIVLADEPHRARDWGADGVYGPAKRIAGADGLLKLVSAHDGADLAAAGAARADGVFLSPVFPSRSHPGSAVLGIHGFHVLAQQSRVPVIALGGMTRERARALAWPRWGAIDGLVTPPA